MIAVDKSFELDLIPEDFKQYNFSSDEVNKVIRTIRTKFNEHRHNIEENNRIIHWQSFNKILIDFIRRSSEKACENWRKERDKRFRLRQKHKEYLIGGKKGKATDIPTQLKMQMLDFLIYGESFEWGYLLKDEPFIKDYKAYDFLAEIIWAINVEKTLTTENLRGNFNKYKRGSVPGFSPGVRISSMMKSYPMSQS